MKRKSLRQVFLFLCGELADQLCESGYMGSYISAESRRRPPFETAQTSTAARRRRNELLSGAPTMWMFAQASPGALNNVAGGRPARIHPTPQNIGVVPMQSRVHTLVVAFKIPELLWQRVSDFQIHGNSVIFDCSLACAVVGRAQTTRQR